MKRVFGWCLGLGLFWLGGGLSNLEATTFDRLAISELATRSDVIVEAKAREGRSLWMDGTLYTRVTLDVDYVLKGTPQTSMVVLLPGGRDPDRAIPIAVQWPGAPRLEAGEEALLFLHRTKAAGGLGDPYYSIVGFSQGKLSISRTEEGAAVVETAGGVTARGPGRSLTSVEDEVRRALRAPQESR